MGKSHVNMGFFQSLMLRKKSHVDIKSHVGKKIPCWHGKISCQHGIFFKMPCWEKNPMLTWDFPMSTWNFFPTCMLEKIPCQHAAPFPDVKCKLSIISTGSAPLTELIPVAVNPGNNCLPLPKVIGDTVGPAVIKHEHVATLRRIPVLPIVTSLQTQTRGARARTCVSPELVCTPYIYNKSTKRRVFIPAP